MNAGGEQAGAAGEQGSVDADNRGVAGMCADMIAAGERGKRACTGGERERVDTERERERRGAQEWVDGD